MTDDTKDDERKTYEVAVSMYYHYHIEAQSRDEARERAEDKANYEAPAGWTIDHLDVAGPFE